MVSDYTAPGAQSQRKYGPKTEYTADVCPAADSPDFLKKHPLTDRDGKLDAEGYRRMMAALAHGI